MKKLLSKKKKRWITGPNVISALLIVFILSMLIFPQVKAVAIIGLMKVGLFRPTIPSGNSNVNKLQPVPPATFLATNGTSLNLASLKGKVVFVNFWATWCPPCLAELPGINSLRSSVAKDTNMVFIMADADRDFVKSAKFMASHRYRLPLYKPLGNIPASLFSGTLPTSLVINKKGELVYQKEGLANYNTKSFEDYLKKLSGE